MWLANLSLEPILKPFWCQLVKLFETVTPPSKRMEKHSTHSIHSWPDVTPQIAFSSKGKVPNRNKTNSSIKPSKFHFKYVFFGDRKTREEWRICLKIYLFGFPDVLVLKSVTTAGRKVVSSLALIGPFQFEHALKTLPVQTGLDRACSNSIPYIHKLSHTPHILSLGSLWIYLSATMTKISSFLSKPF